MSIFRKKKVGIPPQWRDYGEMSIREYFDFREYYNDMKPLWKKDDDVRFGVASYIYDVDIDALYAMKICDLTNLFKSIEWAFKPVKYHTPKPIYKINGVVYNTCLDMRDCSASQYIDFDLYSKDLTTNYCNLLACILVPVGKKYGEGYDVLKVAKDIEDNLNIEEAESILRFFAITSKRLYVSFLRSLAKTMKKMAKKETDEIAKVKMLRAIVNTNSQIEYITGMDI